MRELLCRKCHKPATEDMHVCIEAVKLRVKPELYVVCYDESYDLQYNEYTCTKCKEIEERERK